MLTVVLAYLAGLLPMVAGIVYESRRHIGAVWVIFGPLFVYSLAYTLLALVRPALVVQGDVSYEFTRFNPDSFTESLLLIAAANYFFTGAYLLVRYRRGWRLLPQHAEGTSRREQQLLLLLLVVSTFATIAVAAGNGMLTADLGANRTQYLQAAQGVGLVTTAIVTPGTFILWIYFVWQNNPDEIRRFAKVTYVVCALAWFAVNVMVSNRSFVTIVLMGLIFIAVSKRAGGISGLRLLVALALLAGLGVALGLARGTYDEVSGTLLVSLMFLSLTFDMQEMLAHVIHAAKPLEFGRSYLEDMWWTYVPRSLFPQKPLRYGTTDLEEQYVGFAGEATMTFPIGIFGEAYANFGILGLLAVPAAIGALLAAWQLRLFRGVRSGAYGHWDFVGFYLYFTLAGNTLGYLRSVGQFASALVFQLVTFAALIGFVWLGSRAFRR